MDPIMDPGPDLGMAHNWASRIMDMTNSIIQALGSDLRPQVRSGILSINLAIMGHKEPHKFKTSLMGLEIHKICLHPIGPIMTRITLVLDGPNKINSSHGVRAKL